MIRASLPLDGFGVRAIPDPETGGSAEMSVMPQGPIPLPLYMVEADRAAGD
jgi:hypothetical protein